ncbi:aromatic hydrocarbon degradation membrane protein [Alcanivorax sp. MD8A]|jgi:long-subunit fatty acid transport protein|uniref:Aromatic hydrocarbon degradation protein n=1 Tax=Alcanivorax profundi TaxID=2338368 RepID=A0A418Y0E8_9GAMM|nr:MULTISPECIES: outer membrane protein transport protein [Alcanivorax]ERP90048.1 aromatic hydrocarbon degradation protein [Alcanivorax sp. P2S70]PNE01904.1 aromatic hydrocarbon degradation membrane protein [Alcanivorax sp. MD8A]RJG18750.1 aromatic hydrocarbon degradation protein [Alcanivorax profundi]
MTIRKLSQFGAAAFATSLLAAPVAWGAMGNTASTYGLLPIDVGTAQGMSLFNTQASALYYNPAYLTRDPRGEMTVGLLHGEHDLRVSSNGNPSGGGAAVIRDGDKANVSDTQQQVIALKTDLTDMMKGEHPLYFAIIAGVEKYGEEMLAFESQNSREGQFMQYGRQPLFLNLGGGLEVANGITTGASAHVSLRSEATLIASADLAGETQYEELTVTAKPIIRPVLSMNMEWDKIFCGKEDCGFWTGLETAFAFRGHTEARTAVESNLTIPGTVIDPGITVLIDTIDSYQPDIFSAGLLYHFSDNFRASVSVEQQNWKDLEDQLERDTVKDQANAKFKDIIVPRIGAEWTVNDHIILFGGVAYQESPLESIQTPDVNYFDNDRLIVGVGSALIIKNPPILAYPMRLDFGYQYQQLQERDFELTSTNPSVTNPYESVSTDGDVHVFSGSLTLKF